jgi:hypothetical protein
MFRKGVCLIVEDDCEGLYDPDKASVPDNSTVPAFDIDADG